MHFTWLSRLKYEPDAGCECRADEVMWRPAEANSAGIGMSCDRPFVRQDQIVDPQQWLYQRWNSSFSARSRPAFPSEGLKRMGT